MTTKSRVKIIVDLCMSLALLLLMAHNLIGDVAHEWIGVSMFALAIVHNLLNLHWYRNLLKGRYNAYRAFQAILDMLVLACIVGLMISGIMLSRHVFSFLSIDSGFLFARTLHMLAAYWGLVLMAMHAGLHANAMMAMLRKAAHISKPSTVRVIVLRAVALLICAYGAYAFYKRQIGPYMFLLNQFAFFDYNEPLIFFLADYLAIMAGFICLGHYIACTLKKVPSRIRAQSVAQL